MWGGDSAAGGGGGLNPSALAGYATQQYVEENYVGKPFFNDLFTIHGKEKVTIVDGGTTTETETEIIMLPNEIPSTVTTTDEETGVVTTTERTITSIEANYGFWSESFISALGLNSGGGGGGTSLNEPLLSINQAGLAAHPSASGQTIVWNGSAWVYGNAGGGGGGTGTVTSVAMTVPTGFDINGSPITASGTLALSFASGYSLPTTAKQSNWDTAFANSHTHANKSVLDGITSSQVTNWDEAVIGLGFLGDRVTTLEGYFTSGKANSAAQADRLSGTNSYTVWGQTYWQNGVPKSVTGALTSVTNITMSGQISIGGFVIEVVDGKLKFNGDIYATGGVSALGQSSGGSSLVLTEPLATINSSNLGTPSATANQTLVWNGSRWTYGTIGGGGVTLNEPLSSINNASLGTPSSGQTLIYNGSAWTYGTPATSANGTFWGNSWSNGGTLSGTMTLDNNSQLRFKNSGGTAMSAMTMDSSNNLVFGEGFTASGYNTYLRGNSVIIQTGTSHTNAMQVQADGTVYLPQATRGLRIGDALITYTTDGLKVSALNGTGAMNLYATGGVSALGMSSGGSSSVLPVPTSSDNGKILIVANGEYVLSNPTTVYSGSSAPSSSQGNDGDVYLQLS